MGSVVAPLTTLSVHIKVVVMLRQLSMAVSYLEPSTIICSNCIPYITE